MNDAPTTTDDAEMVAEWRAAMEGVSAGHWRHYRAPLRPGMGIINEVQCRAKAPVVQWTGFNDSNRKEPKHALNAAWIARCSPSGISDLLALIDELMAEVEAATTRYVTAEYKLTAAEAEIARLRPLVEILSRAADELSPTVPDDERHWPGSVKMPTARDLRRARSALNHSDEVTHAE